MSLYPPTFEKTVFDRDNPARCRNCRHWTPRTCAILQRRTGASSFCENFTPRLAPLGSADDPTLLTR